jgi:hypothetical protein
MRRSDFLRRLAVVTGGLLLPGMAGALARHYDKYYLLQCFVRGFRFYEGPTLLDEIKEGDELELVREADNAHDPCAIALHWNGKKIGFVPAESNEILSRLLDIGLPELMAEVTFLKKEAATWENVSIAIYVLKERTEATPAASRGAYLTLLDTPTYYSLKRRDEIVTRLYKNGSSSYEPDDWYEYLEEGSRNDSIYSQIHNKLKPDVVYGVDDKLFALKREQLSTTRLPESAMDKIGQWMKQSDVVFADDGYVALSFQEAEGLVERVSDLSERLDMAGNRFIELVISNQ